MHRKIVMAVFMVTVLCLGLSASFAWAYNLPWDFTAPYTSDANTVGLWHLDDSTGSTIAVNSSGNGSVLDGTLVDLDPDNDWVAGKFGGAIDLSGTAGYIDVASNQFLDIAANLTVECWVKRDDSAWVSAWEDIVSREGSTSGYLLRYYMYQPACTVGIQTSTGRQSLRVDRYTPGWTGAILDDQLWHHLAMTYIGDILKLYVDGDLVGSTTAPEANCPIYPSGKPVRMGNNAWVGGRPFPGQIDEVRVREIIPEPSALLLLGGGLLGLLLFGWKSKK